MEVLEFGLDDHAVRQVYDDLFESCPRAFIQQSTWWAEVIAALGPDRPIFLLCRDAERAVGGLPLYLFTHPLGNILTSVPQAGPLGGVFVRPGLPEAQRDAAYAVLLAAAQSVALRHECLSLTLITNPFEPDAELYHRHLAPELALQNYTQYIAVEETVRDGRIVLRDYTRRSNLSRNVRKAHASGLVTTSTPDPADLAAWYEIHRRRHEELGARPLPWALFEGVLRVLAPRNKALFLFVKDGPAIASGCLYIHHREVLDVFMLSMDSRYAELSPNFMNTEQSLVAAAGLGVRVYNWQSSNRRTGGVYGYKKQWGSLEASYQFVTKVCAPARLRDLDKATLAREYAGHYVVPFAALDRGLAPGVYEKP